MAVCWRIAWMLMLAGPVLGALGSNNEDSETCQQYPRDVAAMLQGAVGVQRVAEVLSPGVQERRTGGNMRPTVMPPMQPAGTSMPATVTVPHGNSSTVMPPMQAGGSNPGSRTKVTHNIYGHSMAGGGDVSIHFGGPKRKGSDGSIVYRPEAVHSEVCDGSKPCAACASKTHCWHGIAPHALEITVPLGDTKTYVATMFASCSSGKGYWQIYVEEILNAKLNVSLNGKGVAPTGGIGDVKEYKIPGDKIGKEAQITVSLSHSQHSAVNSGVAVARLAIFAMASKYVDTCMDRTFCLKKLGDGSDAAFELRNNNRRQYECLTGKPASNLVKVCTEWRACFTSQKNGSHEKELLKLLSAVFSKKSALLDVSSSVLAGDKKGCLDPAAQDAEAVECECLDGMVKACKAAGITDHEKCFLGEMCKSGKVCDSWKKENCPNALLMLRSSGMNQKTSDTLDGSMAGKCTSSTRQ